MIGKVHVCMCLRFESIKSTAGEKTRFFPSPFFISTSRFFILEFLNDHRSAAEKNEMDGYVFVQNDTA